MSPLVFDGKHLPKGWGVVNRGDRPAVAKTIGGQVYLDLEPGQALVPTGPKNRRAGERGRPDHPASRRLFPG